MRAPDPALCPGETVGAVTAAGFHSADRIAEGGSARRRGERKMGLLKKGEAGPRRKGPASHTLTLEIGGSAVSARLEGLGNGWVAEFGDRLAHRLVHAPLHGGALF